MWEVTEHPKGQPPRASVAHDPKEVNMLLRITPEQGYYTINRIQATHHAQTLETS